MTTRPNDVSLAAVAVAVIFGAISLGIAIGARAKGSHAPATFPAAASEWAAKHGIGGEVACREPSAGTVDCDVTVGAPVHRLRCFRLAASGEPTCRVNGDDR